MAFQTPRCISRRTVLAVAPGGILAGATSRVTLAQPTAADPVSFYLGQVLALATLQAQSVRRLRPLLVSPNAADGTWQAAAAAEAGVIGAVASVLGAMEPPPDLTASVAELRLASVAYQGAAEAARSTAGGDLAALDVAGVRLTEGATHILLWLDALTAETGNDWGDGLRTLTAVSTPVPVADEAQVETPAESVPEAPVETEPAEEPAEDEPAEDQQNDRQARNRQNQQDEGAEEAEDAEVDEGSEPNRRDRQNRQNRQNREERAAAE